MNNRYSFIEINDMFGGFNQVNDYEQKLICKTLERLPIDVVDFITKKYIFVSSNIHSWAWYLSLNDITKKGCGIIFLSEELKSKDMKKIIEIIAHEIAHAWLGHKSAILNNLSKRKAKKQEKEANELVEKWLVCL